MPYAESNGRGWVDKGGGARIMYSYIEQHGYIGKNPVKWYRVTIWDMGALVKSDSVGAAKYEAWLHFHDAFDISFGDFIKQAKVKRT
jgi:hypothetical protein